jgi:hypothetical protein
VHADLPFDAGLPARVRVQRDDVHDVVLAESTLQRRLLFVVGDLRDRHGGFGMRNHRRRVRQLRRHAQQQGVRRRALRVQRGLGLSVAQRLLTAAAFVPDAVRRRQHRMQRRLLLESVGRRQLRSGQPAQPVRRNRRSVRQLHGDLQPGAGMLAQQSHVRLQ